MKKALILFVASILLVLAFAVSACSDDNGGTYYPTNEEMKNNLEEKEYTVEVYENINYHKFFIAISAYYDGTLIEAVKGDDYIYLFRLNNYEQCDAVYAILEANCTNYNSLVKIENDEKFGNIVYCGTANAISAAGIKVVNVDVKV